MHLFDSEYKREMLKLIRAGTEETRADVIAVRNLLGSSEMRQRATQTDVASIKTGVRTVTSELVRFNILLEDLNDHFAAARELHWD